MDRLQGMEVFVKVADLGSLTAAAQQLGLSKSAVSKHLAALETRLGARLLNRTTRKLALTEQGLTYRDYCSRILAELAEAEATLGRREAEACGRLKINAPMTFGHRHLGPLLPEFMARYPQIEVDLTLNDRFVDLLDEGFDVAVRIGAMPDSSLIARRIAEARQICAASPAYLERHGTPAEPADLARHDCLVYTLRRQPDEWRFLRGEETVAVKVSGSLTANNGDVLHAAALGGVGVIYHPDFIIGADVAAGRLVRLFEPWQTPAVPIHAVYPSQRRPAVKLRVFIDFLVERLGGAPWRQA